ncbi:leucine-rich repeat-containing protein 4C [Halyomorpha halys]|uniref:leucine-rich repeat-containing protein 4C n=1 Tax=Halyomorpha halys TaxID=286706 RepID=UPI0006D4E08D|nr:leucine-rich repeat-containing protein 4C-like [Halyomorpha halys]
MKIIFFIITLCLLTSVVESVKCPYYCQCLVSKHLRHVQCIGKGLISVDLNVPHSVQWLQLSNNLIYELEDNIFETLGLRHIIELNLDKNAIQSVGLNTFSGLKKLKAVDLSDNRLHSIPSGVFQKIPSLIIVFLQGNPLNHLKSTEPFLISSSIQILNISYCRIRHIPELALSSLPSLVKLNISSNHIENIDYFSYRDLMYLEEIDLSNNKIICDYNSEEFLTWASVESIKIFGTVCLKLTTPLPTVKTMEKMVMYDNENAVPETEDLSVNFDSDCSCSTSDSKDEKLSEKPVTETKESNKNDYLSLFLVLTFVSGFVIGISATVSFWICYRVFRSRERHRLWYTSIHDDDLPPSYEHLFNN